MIATFKRKLLLGDVALLAERDQHTGEGSLLKSSTIIATAYPDHGSPDRGLAQQIMPQTILSIAGSGLGSTGRAEGCSSPIAQRRKDVTAGQ